MVYIPLFTMRWNRFQRIVKRGKLKRLAYHSKAILYSTPIKINLVALPSPIYVKNRDIAIAYRIDAIPAPTDTDAVRGGEAIAIAGNGIATGSWLFKSTREKIGFHDFLQ